MIIFKKVILSSLLTLYGLNPLSYSSKVIQNRNNNSIYHTNDNPFSTFPGRHVDIANLKVDRLFHSRDIDSLTFELKVRDSNYAYGNIVTFRIYFYDPNNSRNSIYLYKSFKEEPVPRVINVNFGNLYNNYTKFNHCEFLIFKFTFTMSLPGFEDFEYVLTRNIYNFSYARDVNLNKTPSINIPYIYHFDSKLRYDRYLYDSIFMTLASNIINLDNYYAFDPRKIIINNNIFKNHHYGARLYFLNNMHHFKNLLNFDESKNLYYASMQFYSVEVSEDKYDTKNSCLYMSGAFLNLNDYSMIKAGNLKNKVTIEADMLYMPLDAYKDCKNMKFRFEIDRLGGFLNLKYDFEVNFDKKFVFNESYCDGENKKYYDDILTEVII